MLYIFLGILIIVLVLLIPFLAILRWIDRKVGNVEDDEKPWLEKTQENLESDLNDKNDDK